MAPTSYSLTVINDSEQQDPIFAVFAEVPSNSGFDTLALAWLTQQIDSSNQYTFTWDIVWGFVWSASGTKAGYQWAGMGKAPADANSNTLCKVAFDYNGDFEFSPVTSTADGQTLTIADSPLLPLPSVKPSSVGVTLDGNPACVVDAGPNLFQTFTVHPTYYIDAGTYVAGQMVDGDSVTGFQELEFKGGSTALTATLNQDNTWTVQDSQEVNFAATLGKRRARRRRAESEEPGAPMDTLGDCYSARRCEGKVLGRGVTFRACQRMQGKSWEETSTGTCYPI